MASTKHGAQATVCVTFAGTLDTAERARRALLQRLGEHSADHAEWLRLRIEPAIETRFNVHALRVASRELLAGAFDGLVLLSRQAVHGLALAAGNDRAAEAARGQLDAARPLRVACVGDATAAAAREAGLVPTTIAAEGTAEGLVSEALDQGWFDGQRVLVPRSAQGDPAVFEPLRGRVRDLCVVEAYDTRPQPLDVASWHDELAWCGGSGTAAAGRAVHTWFVAVLSSSSVHALRAGLPESLQHSLVRHVRWVAIGPSTADALRSAGWSPGLVAQPPGLQGLVQALADDIQRATTC